ncbi:MAG TPA: TetR/AcrR family transcriptional regulator [Polyangiales bacterium]
MNVKVKSRDLAKQETRDALIRAGMSAFSEEGVDLPSLDAICARAGFTRGAFYVHFKDREDFLGAVVDTVLQDFVNWVISTGEPQGGLIGIVDRFLSIAKEGKLPFTDRQRLLLQVVSRGTQPGTAGEKRYKPLIDEAALRLSEAAKQGQAAGIVKRDLEPQQIGILLVAAAVGFMALVDAGLIANFDDIRNLVHRLVLERED